MAHYDDSVILGLVIFIAVTIAMVIYLAYTVFQARKEDQRMKDRSKSPD